MKKFIVLMVLTVAIVLLPVGYTNASSGEIIRVGTMPNHIGNPIEYAKENGLYEEAGLNVQVILFPTGAPINEALSAEQIDIASSGMASVFALASGDNYWLGDIVKTVNGLGVYVRPDSPILKDKGLIEGYPSVYGSKETIKGLTILGALGTSDQFEAIRWAQLFGLSGNDFLMLNMDRGPAVQAFKAGQGDAIACGGPPYNYELEDAGFIQAAGLTEVSGMTISDGIVARKKFVDSRTEDVKKFLKVTYEVIDKFYADDDLLAEFAIKFYNENGKDYSEEMMQGELNDKDYIGSVTISAPDYRFGSTMVGMGGFYVMDGKIEPELEENIYTGLYPDLLAEVLGVDIKVYEN
ncbi:MAG: ABC transporter substrate-binding protein [Firmicutes bacterium]|nr:ABC transporter substrate-binding protein [Bacillota bacterium]